uniref:S-acyltransferase n=1 Tax=Populus trichocarpa TaxID=3694 RepID=A0A3N7FTM2_POPTR
MEWKRFLSIPVCSVFLLMGFVYYITVFIFIEDWVGLQSSAGTLNAMIFTFMASLCLFSFLFCVLKEPGYVPSPYVPDVEGAAVPPHQEPLNNSSQLRRCDKCVTYKPPRAHHCRVCRRCVLRMDHHCLWINNCVGYWNYKAFFILVLYATIASIYSSMILACSGHDNQLCFSEELEFQWKNSYEDFFCCFWSNDVWLEHNIWNSFGLAYLPHVLQYDNH